MNRPRGNLQLVTSEERELDAALRDIPDNQVRCRAGHHTFAWDETAIGAPLPPTVYAQGRSDGRYQIVDPCPCGVRKVTVTGIGGSLHELDSHLSYPSDWVSVPSHLPRGRRVLRREKIRRTAPQVRALLRTADQRPVADASSVPAARFGYGRHS
jgi:hypothetical protein